MPPVCGYKGGGGIGKEHCFDVYLATCLEKSEVVERRGRICEGAGDSGFDVRARGEDEVIDLVAEFGREADQGCRRWL